MGTSVNQFITHDDIDHSTVQVPGQVGHSDIDPSTIVPPKLYAGMTKEELLKIPDILNPGSSDSQKRQAAGANSLINSLPVIGASVGGLLAGGPTAGIGAVPGAVAGGAAGLAAQKAIRGYQDSGQDYFKKPPTSEGISNETTDFSTNAIGSASQEMGGQASGKIINNGMNKIASALETAGNSSAFKAAGAMLKDFKAAFNRNPNRAQELGHTLLDNGLVQAGDDIGDIASKSSLLKEKTGQDIGNVYDKVLDHLTDINKTAHLTPEAKLAIQSSGLHPEAQAEEMKDYVAQALKGQAGSTAATSKIGTIIDEIAVNGNGITPQKAIKIRSDISSLINWGKKSSELPATQQGLVALRDYMSGKINGQVELLDNVMATPQTQELMKLNKLYSNLTDISDIATTKMLKEQATRFHGPTSMAMEYGRRLASPAYSAGLKGLSEIISGDGMSTVPGAIGSILSNPQSGPGPEQNQIENNMIDPSSINITQSGTSRPVNRTPNFSTNIRPSSDFKKGNK